MMKKELLVGIFLVFILLSSLNFVVAQWNESLNEDLIVYFNFDDNGEEVTGNYTQCFGDADHYDTGGIIGGFYNFTGSEKLQCNVYDSLNLTGQTDLTLSAWVKVDSLGAGGVVVMPKSTTVSHYGLYRHAGNLDWSVDTTSGHKLIEPAVTNIGVWALWTITKNSSHLTGYMNGTYVGTTIAGDPFTSAGGSNNLTLGVWLNLATYFRGGLDEIAIWNRSLNDTEIIGLYNNGNGITYSSTQNETNQTSTNQTGFWNLTETYLYPSNLDYFVGIGTATPRVALDVIGVIYGRDGDLQFGTQDAYGRNQIWNFLPSSVLRLGSLSADGDAQTVSSEGIVVYGNNSRDDAMSSSNYGWARIKPNRFALHNGINGTQSDYFRVDPDGLYLKDDSHVKTFEIIREDGLVDTKTGYSVNSQTGITDNSNFWMCEDSACSSTCQVDIKGGIIVGCD